MQESSPFSYPGEFLIAPISPVLISPTVNKLIKHLELSPHQGQTKLFTTNTQALSRLHYSTPGNGRHAVNSAAKELTFAFVTSLADVENTVNRPHWEPRHEWESRMKFMEDNLAGYGLEKAISHCAG